MYINPRLQSHLKTTGKDGLRALRSTIGERLRGDDPQDEVAQADRAEPYMRALTDDPSQWRSSMKFSNPIGQAAGCALQVQKYFHGDGIARQAFDVVFRAATQGQAAGPGPTLLAHLARQVGDQVAQHHPDQVGDALAPFVARIAWNSGLGAGQGPNPVAWAAFKAEGPITNAVNPAAIAVLSEQPDEQKSDRTAMHQAALTAAHLAQQQGLNPLEAASHFAPTTADAVWFIREFSRGSTAES